MKSIGNLKKEVEYPQGDVYFVVKLTCGVQARGRYKAEAETFEKAARDVYNQVITKWGRAW